MQLTLIVKESISLTIQGSISIKTKFSITKFSMHKNAKLRSPLNAPGVEAMILRTIATGSLVYHHRLFDGQAVIIKISY